MAHGLEQRDQPCCTQLKTGVKTLGSPTISRHFAHGKQYAAHGKSDESFPNYACRPKLVLMVALTSQLSHILNISGIFLSERAHQTLIHTSVRTKTPHGTFLFWFHVYTRSSLVWLQHAKWTNTCINWEKTWSITFHQVMICSSANFPTFCSLNDQWIQDNGFFDIVTCESETMVTSLTCWRSDLIQVALCSSMLTFRSFVTLILWQHLRLHISIIAWQGCFRGWLSVLTGPTHTAQLAECPTVYSSAVDSGSSPGHT